MAVVAGVTEQNRGAVEEMTARSDSASQSMENIASVSEENSAAVEEVSASAEEVAAQAAELSQSAATLARMSHSLDEVVSRFTLKEESMEEQRRVIGTFKQAHLGWVKKVEDLLAGRIELKEEEISDHTQCSLGLWYQGRGQLNWGELPEFAAIDEPHIRCHRMVKDAVRLHAAGKMNGQSAAVLRNLAATSGEVVQALDRLEKKITG